MSTTPLKTALADPDNLPDNWPQVRAGREITDATDDVEATDSGKVNDANRATAITLTIPLATMGLDDEAGYLQTGAGQLTIVVADGAKQTIIGAPKTAGVGSMVSLWCKDNTTDAEVYVILGGVA